MGKKIFHFSALKKTISGPGDEVQPPDFSKHKIPVLS